jgi:hypothetical protein
MLDQDMKKIIVGGWARVIQQAHGVTANGAQRDPTPAGQSVYDYGHETEPPSVSCHYACSNKPIGTLDGLGN